MSVAYVCFFLRFYNSTMLPVPRTLSELLELIGARRLAEPGPVTATWNAAAARGTTAISEHTARRITRRFAPRWTLHDTWCALRSLRIHALIIGMPSALVPMPRWSRLACPGSARINVAAVQFAARTLDITRVATASTCVANGDAQLSLRSALVLARGDPGKLAAVRATLLALGSTVPWLYYPKCRPARA
jgi:hypothetical protein